MLCVSYRIKAIMECAKTENAIDRHNRLRKVSKPRHQIVLYDRKRAANTTPITENPETVRVVASELELGVDLAAEVADPDTAVGLVEAPVDEPLAEVVVADTVGRLVNSSALEKVLQLEEEGTRATYGIVVIGPRDSGG